MNSPRSSGALSPNDSRFRSPSHPRDVRERAQSGSVGRSKSPTWTRPQDLPPLTAEEAIRKARQRRAKDAAFVSQFHNKAKLRHEQQQNVRVLPNTHLAKRKAGFVVEAGKQTLVDRPLNLPLDKGDDIMLSIRGTRTTGSGKQEPIILAITTKSLYCLKVPPENTEKQNPAASVTPASVIKPKGVQFGNANVDNSIDIQRHVFLTDVEGILEEKGTHNLLGIVCTSQEHDILLTCHEYKERVIAMLCVRLQAIGRNMRMYEVKEATKFVRLRKTQRGKAIFIPMRRGKLDHIVISEKQEIAKDLMSRGDYTVYLSARTIIPDDHIFALTDFACVFIKGKGNDDSAVVKRVEYSSMKYLVQSDETPGYLSYALHDFRHVPFEISLDTDVKNSVIEFFTRIRSDLPAISLDQHRKNQLENDQLQVHEVAIEEALNIEEKEQYAREQAMLRELAEKYETEKEEAIQEAIQTVEIELTEIAKKREQALVRQMEEYRLSWKEEEVKAREETNKFLQDAESELRKEQTGHEFTKAELVRIQSALEEERKRYFQLAEQLKSGTDTESEVVDLKEPATNSVKQDKEDTQMSTKSSTQSSKSKKSQSMIDSLQTALEEERKKAAEAEDSFAEKEADLKDQIEQLQNKVVLGESSLNSKEVWQDEVTRELKGLVQEEREARVAAEEALQSLREFQDQQKLREQLLHDELQKISDEPMPSSWNELVSEIEKLRRLRVEERRTLQSKLDASESQRNKLLQKLVEMDAKAEENQPLDQRRQEIEKDKALASYKQQNVLMRVDVEHLRSKVTKLTAQLEVKEKIISTLQDQKRDAVTSDATPRLPEVERELDEAQHSLSLLESNLKETKTNLEEALQMYQNQLKETEKEQQKSAELDKEFTRRLAEKDAEVKRAQDLVIKNSKYKEEVLASRLRVSMMKGIREAKENALRQLEQENEQLNQVMSQNDAHIRELETVVTELKQQTFSLQSTTPFDDVSVKLALEDANAAAETAQQENYELQMQLHAFEVEVMETAEVMHTRTMDLEDANELVDKLQQALKQVGVDPDEAIKSLDVSNDSDSVERKRQRSETLVKLDAELQETQQKLHRELQDQAEKLQEEKEARTTKEASYTAEIDELKRLLSINMAELQNTKAELLAANEENAKLNEQVIEQQKDILELNESKQELNNRIDKLQDTQLEFLQKQKAREMSEESDLSAVEEKLIDAKGKGKEEQELEAVKVQQLKRQLRFMEMDAEKSSRRRSLSMKELVPAAVRNRSMSLIGFKPHNVSFDAATEQGPTPTTDNSQASISASLDAVMALQVALGALAETEKMQTSTYNNAVDGLRGLLKYTPKSDVEALQQQVEYTTTKNVDALANIAKQSAKVSAKINAIKRSIKDPESFEGILHKLESEVAFQAEKESMLNHIADLQKRLSLAEAEYKDTRTKIITLEDELLTEQDEVRKMKEGLHHRELMAEETMKMAEDNLIRTEIKLFEAQKDKDSIEHERDKISVELNDATTRIAKLEKIAQSSSERAHSADAVRKVEASLAAAKSDARKAASQNKSLQAQMRALLEDNDKLHEKLDRLRTEKAMLQSTYDNLSSTLEQRMQETLADHLQAMQSELFDKTMLTEEHNERVDSLQDELDTLHEMVVNLSKQKAKAEGDIVYLRRQLEDFKS